MLLGATNDKRLKAGIISLHKDWVLGEKKDKNRVEKGGLEEQRINRNHYEQSNTQLKQKIKTTA
jgi:hypothetical protein